MSDSLKHTITSEQAAQQAYGDTVQMMQEHGYCTVTIKAGSRSLSQNDLYWMWLDEMCEHVKEKLGAEYSKEEMHDSMRHAFLGYDEPRTIGKITVKPQLKSTTKLTVGEMYFYMNKIDMYAAQSLGLYLTRPSDCQYEKLKRKEDGQE